MFHDNRQMVQQSLNVIDSWVPAVAVIDETVKWKGGRIMSDDR